MVTTSSGIRLMIECGVRWAKLQKALKYNLRGFVGCLVSHEHKDHSRAVRDVMQAGIDVYASAGTLGALNYANERRAKVLLPDAGVTLGDSIRVFPFVTNHDAIEPFGFVIKADDEYLLFATDTSHIRQRFLIPFSIIAIACSYDKDILQRQVDAGSINESVAKRLLTSHMEKRVAMRYLDTFCELSKCREIHLLHMSGDDINKAQTKKDFEEKFFIEVEIL